MKTPSTLCHRTDKTRCQFIAKGNAFQCSREKGGCGTTVDAKMPEFNTIKANYEATK